LLATTTYLEDPRIWEEEEGQSAAHLRRGRWEVGGNQRTQKGVVLYTADLGVGKKGISLEVGLISVRQRRTGWIHGTSRWGVGGGGGGGGV